MPQHDIIDNRSEKLIEHILRILPSSERAKFAVGYFFLSGFEPLRKQLNEVGEIRLLIGNTTNYQTLEQLSEGYKRLELVEEAEKHVKFLKRADEKRNMNVTAENIKDAVSLMDQTDEQEELVATVASLIKQKKLKVKVFTRGRLHAKAYIFDYKQDGRYEKGIAIVGSSNLTLSGISHNTELNVVVHGKDNHTDLSRWFDDLWNESKDFDEALMNELKASWALAPVRPYDIYMKTLYELVRDRLEEGEAADILWDDEITTKLADFQRVAVKQAVQLIREYSGCFVSDVVGLGKSFIGAAIVKHFERTDHIRPLIICPATLVEMWEGYNETYQLNARVLSMGMLRESEEQGRNILLDDVKYRDRDFILIDESHNFRHHTTQKYEILQAYLSAGRKRCVFLTATPRNKAVTDVYNQIKLFHPDDKTDLPIDPQDLKKYFGLIEKGEKRLQDLLVHILIRRTRNHILKWYGFDSQTHQPIDPNRFEEYRSGKRRAYVMVGGRHQFFPKRELETIEYSIEKTYNGLYQRLRGYLGRPKSQRKINTSKELIYARYSLWDYVVSEKQKKQPYIDLHRAGANLFGLMRTLLFKRFESSVYAFRETLKRMIRIHEAFLKSLDKGIVPAGDEAQAILYESDNYEEADLYDALTAASEKYKIEDFNKDKLIRDVKHDLGFLQEMLDHVKDITPEKDAKLQTLLKWLRKDALSKGKLIIFTQFADTARYLFENLNPGSKEKDIEVIYSGDKSKAKVVGRFAPKANPDYKFSKGEMEIRLLVATDVLSEGLNLQDCDKMINYDLHWNPVRLIQRFGRIDRIGSESEVVWGYNFLPETELERTLGLHATLHNRIQEIHDTIGEDAQILDKTELLNEEAMYAIYEKKTDQLNLFEEEGEVSIDLNEAEEIMRQLRKENFTEFERIEQLRDGVRASKTSKADGTFVFCKSGSYKQLFLTDSTGNIISRDIPKILGLLKSGDREPGKPLSKNHNKTVMRVKKAFDEEVKQRATEREQLSSLTHAQRYVIRELRVMFQLSDDEETKAQINILDKAFRKSQTVAVQRELNLLRRNGIIGKPLLKSLTRIYHQHKVQQRIELIEQSSNPSEDIPRIVCSEGLCS
ncbi:MAG: phospholipase D-like domain-containing protein [Bacteroidota bacterium]|nr:phospholipase D-like domain-containing protein [Bacteroidota bacterium]